VTMSMLYESDASDASAARSILAMVIHVITNGRQELSRP
jgi:hypothetical protein